MDIKNYEIFVDVAKTGNFTKSANNKGYTQSAVSHMLKNLEQEVGFSLFIRTKQGVRLTSNGKRLLPLVKELLYCDSRIEQMVADINNLDKGSVSVGSFTSIAIKWLPHIISDFSKEYPNIKIEISEGGTDDICRGIEESTIEIGFLNARHGSNHIDFIPIYQDPLVAVIPKGHPMSDMDAVPIELFNDTPFILSTIGTDYDINYALNNARIRLSSKYTCTDDHSIISMVSNGLGISILPKLLVSGYEHKIAYRPLLPNYERTLGIGYSGHNVLTPVAKKFMEFSIHWITQNV